MIDLTEVQLGFKRVLKQMLLTSNEVVTLDFLTDKANKLNASGLAPGPLSVEEITGVVDSLTLEHAVTFTPSGTVFDPETFEPWIEERKESTQTPRWDAYKQLLVARDWEEPVIKDLEKQTDEIVELMGDPKKPGEWCRKGLLMGEVQSGKTANYIGVLNKALDHGYQVVIVIGGHTNDLRTQTQARMDSDLLGIDSEFVDDNIARGSIRKIGIGQINQTLNAHLMTTVRGDFNSSRSTAGVTWLDSGLPTVFVIKKNAKLIDNVAQYIRTQASEEKIALPLVVIDDEADWGTPNTGSDTDPTRVNKSIRALLDTSKKSTYLGITATPFANIFIDDEAQDADGKDLFPADFIRVLSAPSTYFGISQFFQPLHGGLRVKVEDCLQAIPINHKRDLVVTHLPESLKKSVTTFVLGVALRRTRSLHQKPASMLVNVSRFNLVQSRVFDLVVEHLGAIQNCVKAEFARSSNQKSEMYRELFRVWNDEFSELKDAAWDEVATELLSAIDEFRVELVNSQTSSARNKRRKLMTDDQRRVEDMRPTIFVGGDVLSRGLTLEGLQVSYFVREPRTMDTLMQMGRWFGYRPGYSDLVRVWLPEETAQDFAWCAEVTDELREMLLEMRSRGLTPKNFGLRVRTHPEGFKIVAANKSRSAQQVIEGPIVWENKVKESWRLDSSESSRVRNGNAVENLLSEIARMTEAGVVFEVQSTRQSPIWSGVPLETIQRFFAQFQGHKSDDFGIGLPGRPSIVAEALPEVRGSEKWSVTLVQGDGDLVLLGKTGRLIKHSIRNNLTFDGQEQLITAANRRILSSMSLVHALPRSLEIQPQSQADALATIEHPILLIAALEVKTGSIQDKGQRLAEVEVSRSKPLLAVAVAFPKMDPETAVEAARKAKKYTGNAVYWRIYSEQFDTDDVEESLVSSDA